MVAIDSQVKVATRRLLRRPVRVFLRNRYVHVGKRSMSRFFVRGQFPDEVITSPTCFDASFECDFNDMIHQRVHFFGVWEPNETMWLRSRLSDGDVVVDVGAHTGYYTVLAARAVGPTGRVVAIEPSPNRMSSLTRNVDLNGLTNVRQIEAAITTEFETITLFNSHNAASATTVGDTGMGVEAVVRAARLIDVLTRDEISRIRVLKIDIEGRELDALRSFAPALVDVRDDFELVVELTPEHLAEQGHTPRQVLDLMTDAGFEPWDLPNNYSTDSYVQFARTGEFSAPVAMAVHDPWWDDPSGGQRDIIFARHSAHR